MQGVDGIKTGYTRASGFNLVTSIRRGNRHLVGVVMGGRSGGSASQDDDDNASNESGTSLVSGSDVTTERFSSGPACAARNPSGEISGPKSAPR